MGMFDKFPYRNTRDLNLNWIIKKILELEGLVGAAVSDVAQFLSKKGGKMEGSIDMQGNRIFNVPTPAGDMDVASKKYVDDKTGNYLPLSGGTMTGAVNMGGKKIANVAIPEADGDVATKKYVDDHSGGGVGGDYLPLSGGTMTGAVNMGGNKITSVATPETDTDVATKKYVDDISPNSITFKALSIWITAYRTSDNHLTANLFLPFPTSDCTHNITSSGVMVACFEGGNNRNINVTDLTVSKIGNVLTITATVGENLKNVIGLAIYNASSWTITK